MKCKFGLLSFVLILQFSCKNVSAPFGFTINDPNIIIDLIAEHPVITTPIGLTFDRQDHIYILESHTHSPPKDYDGPKGDKILKGVDKDMDGVPESWIVFAEGIEDGMNLACGSNNQIYVATKNSIVEYRDNDQDGVSDDSRTLLRMIKPDNVYDHAGILGIAIGPEDMIYVSRGNTGGQHWIVEGTDGTRIGGYGDGGNVFRCDAEGKKLEEIATGFWNPFDIKFIADGRLLLTDNDPDSRGPNRLIEVVPGGDYGYKSLYGGSGIHSFVAWNGELPGTLPYAAPLGEAPCGLLDASKSNLGSEFEKTILVNVWEENNIVKIPLKSYKSTVIGEPEVLVQGNSEFHPVAIQTNSKGDIFITDWVIRKYPNHGHGRIWKLSPRNKKDKELRDQVANSTISNRFTSENKNLDELLDMIRAGDVFEKAIARHHLIRRGDMEDILWMLSDRNDEIRLQALLLFFKGEEPLERLQLISLLNDSSKEIRKTALIYIGAKMRADMRGDLDRALYAGLIDTDLVETYLAAIAHIQPHFSNSLVNKTESISSDINRTLPESFLESMLTNVNVSQKSKAAILPFLSIDKTKTSLLIKLLENATEEAYQIALLKSFKFTKTTELERIAEGLVFDTRNASSVRILAIDYLQSDTEENCKAMLNSLDEKDESIHYAAIRFLCKCSFDNDVLEKISGLIESNAISGSKTGLSYWRKCKAESLQSMVDIESFESVVDETGNEAIGKMVFETAHYQCSTCHKINGWGGSFGPDLSNIGSSKSKSQLIQTILNPSEDIAPDWQTWFITDKNGDVHIGRQIDVHLDKAELMNVNGSFDEYEDPISYGVHDQSLMPEGLHQLMTPDEFKDLIAYMVSLN